MRIELVHYHILSLSVSHSLSELLQILCSIETWFSHQLILKLSHFKPHPNPSPTGEGLELPLINDYRQFLSIYLGQKSFINYHILPLSVSHSLYPKTLRNIIEPNISSKLGSAIIT